MQPDSDIVIVGGGFSGTLLAINLLRFAGPRATMVERRADQVARGVAYSAADAGQLLNVRAGGMSAFPDDPGHFARWVEARGAGEPQAFVPRALYGDYLRQTLAAERVGRDDRLHVVEGDACDIDAGALVLEDGSRIAADCVVLATGNLPPHTPPHIDPDTLPPCAYLGDPWRADPAAGLTAADTVVLIGTGLTAVDVALQLDSAGFAGQVLALSRRGLNPRRHVDGTPPPKGLGEPPDTGLAQLLADTRARGDAIGWRGAVDSLRPVTQRLWANADPVVRGRFLRHLRPYWDVHRHRLAPAVADRIDAMIAAGRLRFAAGKICGASGEGERIRLRWRPRHDDGEIETLAARVVNCTGPQGDLTRTDDVLLARLHARGVVRPDPLRLGLEVDAQSRVVGRDGVASDRLCCVGPMTRGGLWEVVAVPDLRRQSWDVARRLANAQWIGGEGL